MSILEIVVLVILGIGFFGLIVYVSRWAHHIDEEHDG